MNKITLEEKLHEQLHEIGTTTDIGGAARSGGAYEIKLCTSNNLAV